MAKCKMPIPAFTVMENTPVDFQITNCDPAVPPEDTTVDIKPIIKKLKKVRRLLLSHLMMKKILNRN